MTEVRRYSAAFWERGPDELQDWEKHKQKIEEGERKREKLQDQVLAITLKCKQYNAPLFEMDLDGLLPPAQAKIFGTGQVRHHNEVTFSHDH